MNDAQHIIKYAKETTKLLEPLLLDGNSDTYLDIIQNMGRIQARAEAIVRHQEREEDSVVRQYKDSVKEKYESHDCGFDNISGCDVCAEYLASRGLEDIAYYARGGRSV